MRSAGLSLAAAVLVLACACRPEPLDGTTMGAQPKSEPEPVRARDPAEPPKSAKAPTKEGARTWTFDTAGETPAGFRTAQTANATGSATWQARDEPDAPSPPAVFGVVASTNPKPTFHIAVVEDVSMADIDIAVMVKALSGALDQGGGPIWRVADDDNYYLGRWNPLEGNVRLYVVDKGVRSQLAEAKVDLDMSVWHSIRVIHEGSTMELLLDDEPVLRHTDQTHSGAGRVGLWTKADAVTLFDDLSIAAP